MPTIPEYDAVVVGSGPNGLAAAITLARAGKSVKVFEAMATPGGGMRTKELTLPGFRHDVCSAVHPLGAGSPFFRSLPLHHHGLKWIYPEVALSHPFEDGTSLHIEQSIDRTAHQFDEDANSYRQLFGALSSRWDDLAEDILGPLQIPSHPTLSLRFGLKALRSAKGLAQSHFTSEKVRALFAGLAAHSIMPLDAPLTAAIGLILGTLAHAVGWPIPQGGAESITDALVSYLRSLGGEIETGRTVTTLQELPASKTVLLDVTPKQFLEIAGDQLPTGYIHRLESYRYGPGVFKMDFAMESPVPWRAPGCKKAGTIHLGGSMQEIIASERKVWNDRHPGKPYVLLSQQSLFDRTRAPERRHTVWAYCHVPNGSTMDMSDAIIAQIERFAPGFRERILKTHVMNTAQMEAYNPNYIGGDINGGVQDLRQLFTRPTARRVPYATPLNGIYLCSSSTPPGGGVHGMCGYHAARAVLREVFSQ